MNTFNISSKPPKRLISDLGNILVEGGANEVVTIATVNPEQVVQAVTDDLFRHILNSFSYAVADGIGIVWAINRLSGKKVPRISGADLAEALVSLAIQKQIPVMFIGGQDNVAQLAKTKFRHLDKISQLDKQILATQGYMDISNPTDKETQKILKQIQTHKPKLVLVGYGAPFQEVWIHTNLDQLKANGVKIAMVVGGTFDYWSGRIPRAPKSISNFGLEWLYRLGRQPWRIKRQFRLVKFVRLVFRRRIDFVLKSR